MAPKTKTEADHIVLLLAIIDHNKEKLDYDAVAKDTGLYKSGKFVKQALDGIKKKYGNGQNGVPTAATASGDTTLANKAFAKKRGKAADSHGDEIKPKTKKVKEEPSAGSGIDGTTSSAGEGGE